MIESDRLIVRLPEQADVPEIVRFYRDNRQHLQPFSPLFNAELFDESQWKEQVAARAVEFAMRESFRAFIFAKAAPLRAIGNINLTQVVRGAFQSCVLGYNLAVDAEGHGYMTEAVCAVVAFAFDQWRLHRVAASYMPRNERSAAVLQRCGFTIEGRALAYLRINGRWEDHVLTAMVNPRWSPA